MSITPFKNMKMKIFAKLLIGRYILIGITLLKPHLVCTFFNKKIDVRKCERKLGLYEYFW